MDIVHLLLLLALAATVVVSAAALPRTLRGDGYGHRPPPGRAGHVDLPRT